MSPDPNPEPHQDPDESPPGPTWDIDLSGLEELATGERREPEPPAVPAEASEEVSLPPPVEAPFDDVRAVLRRLRVSVERIDVRMTSIEDAVLKVSARLEDLIAQLPGSARAGAASQDASRALRKDLVVLGDRLLGELAGLRRGLPRPVPAAPEPAPAAPPPAARGPDTAVPEAASRREQELQRLREKVWGSEPPKT